MSVPLWLLAIAPPCFAMIGFFVCACLTAGKVTDIDSLRSELARVNRVKDHRTEQGLDLLAAHARLADAHSATMGRIDRALECETAGANATVKRMARILRGDA